MTNGWRPRAAAACRTAADLVQETWLRVHRARATFAPGGAVLPWIYAPIRMIRSTGAGTLSATYTLPTGTLQAVRARFRYNGTAAACGTGSYDDHDDLVFAVNP